MSAIYIHIPFCKKACYYCDFHFSTSLKKKEEMIEALCRELELRYHYLKERNLSSVYFGGGTPSLLNGNEITSILNTINKYFTINKETEITLEANPDDLDSLKAIELRNAGLNRISIGVQSFFDEDLKAMNRSHTSNQARESIDKAQEGGFENITIDLIYGLPRMTRERWMQNLQTAFRFGLPHYSCYCLTVEKRTALYKFVEEKKVELPDDIELSEQYYLLTETAKRFGYVHYEISNFCMPGMESKHNSSYWNNIEYLGIGPSAHSYNLDSRQWNVANNLLYIKGIKEEVPQFEKEILSEVDKYNEYIMTHLRTISGISLDSLNNVFGSDIVNSLVSKAKSYIQTGHLEYSESELKLSDAGMFISDKIIADLFV